MKHEKMLQVEHNSVTEQSAIQQDKERYQAFLNGDQVAFEELVIAHKNQLIFFINQIVHNITIAEDIAQDAFVEVLIHKDRYNYSTGFRTYLLTIGRNKAVDYIRKNKRYVLTMEQEETASEADELEQTVLLSERQRMLYDALKELKTEYQQIITLVDLEGQSYAQAAQVMDKSEGQIKVLVHRARKRLGKELERKGFTYEK